MNTNSIDELDKTEKPGLFWEGLAGLAYLGLRFVFGTVDFVLGLYRFVVKTDPIELLVMAWTAAAIGLFIGGLVTALLS